MTKWIKNLECGSLVELRGSVIIYVEVDRKGREKYAWIEVNGISVGYYKNFERCKEIFEDIVDFMQNPYMFFVMPKE